MQQKATKSNKKQQKATKCNKKQQKATKCNKKQQKATPDNTCNDFQIFQGMSPSTPASIIHENADPMLAAHLPLATIGPDPRKHPKTAHGYLLPPNPVTLIL
jgi:hypothetical protein